MKGKLIVIEGGDAAGKKTQAELLMQYLKAEGHQTDTISIPQYEENMVGRLLRECMDGMHSDFVALDPKITSTIFAADRVETLPKISAALEDGITLVFDRYTTANIIHQGAKVPAGAERTAVMRWIYELEHTRLGIPVPDVVVALDVPAAIRRTMMERRLAKTGQSIDTTDAASAHQAAVDTCIAELVSLYPNATAIDCCTAAGELRTIEDIQAQVQTYVRDILEA